MGRSSILQRIEIGDDILPIGFAGEIDEHPGPANEAGRVCEEFVEIVVVQVMFASFIAGEKSNPATVPLLLPTMPASDGAILFTPACVEWQTAQWLANTV